ncbi:MAG: diacylglycerol kinase family protein [Bacteroidia bacterium]
MKKKLRFIINPISGIGKQKIVEKIVEREINKEIFDYDIVYTEAPKHATLLAKQAAQENIDIVAVVGGDGSVNETGNGLIGSNTALAIIPAGSGNGLARHLGIPIDLSKAIKILHHIKIKKIDTVKINETSFINIAGIGFDAHVAWKFSKFGKRGFSSYIKVTIRELLKYKAQKYELTIDEKKISREAFLICFANGSQWGNDTLIAPQANVSDGKIEIVILKKFSFWQSPSIAFKLARKKIHTSSSVETIRGRKIFVKQQNSIAHIDGEPMEFGKEIAIEVNPLSLNIVIPA